MKLKHKARDSLIMTRNFYYKKIKRKPRIYFIESTYLNTYPKRYSGVSNLELFSQKRKYSFDFIESLKSLIRTIKSR